MAEQSHARRSKKDVAKTGNRERGPGNEHGEREKEKKWQQKRELEMKLLIGLGLKLGFLPTIHYRVCHCRSPLLVLLTSRKKQTGRQATKSFVSTYKKWNVAIVQQKEEIYKKTWCTCQVPVFLITPIDFFPSFPFLSVILHT